MAKSFKCKVCHADYIQYYGCEREVKRHERVCCEGVFNKTGTRKRILERASGYKTCVWLDTPLETRRQRKGWTNFCENLEFQPPSLDEGWDKIVIVHNNDYRHAEVVMREE